MPVSCLVFLQTLLSSEHLGYKWSLLAKLLVAFSLAEKFHNKKFFVCDHWLRWKRNHFKEIRCVCGIIAELNWQPRQIDSKTPIKVAPRDQQQMIFIFTVWWRLASVLMQTKQGTGERIVCLLVRSPHIKQPFVARPETMEGPLYKMHVVNWLLSGAKTRPLFCAS